MARQNIIWVIDDDDSIRFVLQRALEKEDMKVESFNSANDILELLDRKRPDVIVTDIRMPGISGLDLLTAISEKAPEIPVIIMTAHTDLDSAVASYKKGAFEYLPKPFDLNDAVRLVRRANEHRRKQVKSAAPQRVETSEIIGEAPAMQEVFRAIGRLSGSHLNVLITGESGTGKELVAKALHSNSPRIDGPFIAINVAAIPSELLESELFGHERGAFTGAQSQHKGRFEQANGGTLFLDEIGDMSADLQTRLLRVLSDGQFYRVGGHVQIKCDVRIIAATHQNLEERVRQNLFREDLFHRLNVIHIHLPALRKRREDIPELSRSFLAGLAQELGVETKHLTDEAEKYLVGLDWPGNVRQLQNTCRWLTVMAPGQSVRIEDLPPELKQPQPGDDRKMDWIANLRSSVDQQLSQGEADIYKDLNDSFERTLIEAALNATGGRKQEAAKKLGWGRNTLTRKLKELRIEV